MRKKGKQNVDYAPCELSELYVVYFVFNLFVGT